MQMTMPGVPTVFMGDELGLTAVDGEHARTPFPWRQQWDDETVAAYRTWIGLRRGYIALRRGGLRWLHVGRDSWYHWSASRPVPITLRAPSPAQPPCCPPQAPRPTPTVWTDSSSHSLDHSSKSTATSR
jgi:glycosidase